MSKKSVGEQEPCLRRPFWSAGACSRFALRKLASAESRGWSRSKLLPCKSGGKPPHSKRLVALKEPCALLKIGILTLALWPGIRAAEAQTVSPKPGGTVVVAQASEPKTLNPLLAADQPTRDVLYALSADLVHINRSTMRAEPALAKSWSLSGDGRHYTLALREDLRFSDGTPLTADDVVFSFRAYLDPAVNSPQRSLLLVEDKPISVTRLSAHSVRVDLPSPYGPGERLFDSFWILPKHKLEKAYTEGRLAQAWGLGTSPSELATPGPFRLREYVPGQRLVLERNPYYWKRDEAGRALPYLARLELVFVNDQNAQVLRLIAGEVDALGRLRAEDFARLEQSPNLQARDAGAGLEYNFLLFNWNFPGHQQTWFRNLKFRQAMAHAIDREAMVRLVYQGRGAPIWSQVTSGNRLWRTDKLSRYPYDPARAEQLLREAGFRRQGSGPLLDAAGRPVEFSLMVSSSNQLRRKMAVLAQEDLARVGVRAQVTPIEFGAMLDAVLNTRKFEAAIWGLASGDADPNSEMNVWSLRGNLRVWNLDRKGEAAAAAPAPEPWEAEVDRLMRAQMTTTSVADRKSAYDRVQLLVSENLPVIFLVSPHVLAAAHRDLANFEPAVLDPVLLWNCDRWSWRKPRR